MSCHSESGEEFDVIVAESRGIDDRNSSKARRRASSGTVVIDVKSHEKSTKI